MTIAKEIIDKAFQQGLEQAIELIDRGLSAGLSLEDTIGCLRRSVERTFESQGFSRVGYLRNVRKQGGDQNDRM